MKRKITLITLAFILCAGAIWAWDITNKYEMSIPDYMKYSRSLTQEEESFLKNTVINYGIDVEDAPFAFIDPSSGQNMGILADYFNQLSVVLENNFKPAAYENYHLAMKLKAGEIDAAVLSKTESNAQVFLFTQSLYTERNKILVQGDSPLEHVNDVSDISIAVIAGTKAHHAANDFFQGDQGVELVLTENLDESFYLLGMGEVDAILGDEAKISYHLNQAIKSNLFKFLGGSIYEEEVAVAVNQEQTVLLDILNKGILEMKKNNQYSHIHSKWFGSFIPELEVLPADNRTADVCFVILVIVAVLFIWNLTVSNRVTQRTIELHESRTELRRILDSLMDGILVTDSEGNVQVCNEIALKLLGKRSEMVIDRNVTQIPELEPYLSHINEKDAIRYGERYYLISRRFLDKEENKLLIVIEDYTDRYQYERLTRQEAKMIAIGELSASFAHEIRNPLGLIKSYSYLLRKRNQGNIELHPLNVIDDSVNRINGLIENLQGFSKLSREENVRVNIQDLMLSLLALERKNFEKNEIETKTCFQLPAGPFMKINADVLKLVMVNLMNNSIDALRETNRGQKWISISVKSDGGQLYVDFSDNGVGIPKENMEMIFNPFFTTKETGTGLGLYILDSELRGIGGSITVESMEQEGATFHLILPIERENCHE